MKLSQQGETWLKGKEVLRLVGYLPTPDDKPTIGWGHTGPEVHVGEAWLEEECEVAFQGDVSPVEKAVNYYVSVPLSQPQFDACCFIAFNIGWPNWAHSTVLKRINAKAPIDEIEKGWMMWTLQNGKILKGLVNRREEEFAIFKNGYPVGQPTQNIS